MRRPAAALVAAALLAGCTGEVELDGRAFRDDFSNTRSGFPDTTRLGYAGGELRLRAERPRETVFGALDRMPVVRNMEVSVRVRFTRGGVAGTGVTCRVGTKRGGPELYAFLVTADGAAQILRIDRFGFTSIASGEVPGGAAAGRRGLRLTGRCVSAEQELLVDGRRLLRGGDRRLRTGRAGVILLAGTDRTAEARLDDLLVRTTA